MRTKTFFSSTKALTAGLIAFAATALHAQVGVNNTGTTPNASAILDLQTGNTGVNKGFLPQSVALTNVATAAPVTTPATGLIVYSSTAPSGGDGTGYYYWNGSSWITLGTGSAATSLTGSGITDYVAVWTSASNLSTGLIQDNGTGVGINIAPFPGYITYIAAATSGTALDAYTVDPAGYGVGGYNAAAGSGVYGASAAGGYGVEGDGTYYGGGSGGYFTDGTDYAITGDVTDAAGVYASGSTDGVYATSAAGWPVFAYSATSDEEGVYGECDGSAGWGVDGYSTGSSGVGVWAEADAASAYGLDANSTSGTAVYAYGGTYGGAFNDVLGDYFNAADNADGYGFDAYGTQIGGFFSDAAGDYAYVANSQEPDGGILAYGVTMGGYFEDAGGDYVYEAYNGNANYSTGAKNTIVRDETGQYRGLTCTESPEVLFQDYGTSQLVNGRIHIDLDKLFASTVTINQKHPLRVLVTLNDECNGVFVTNRTTTGFDVVELNHGTSNASFTYEVTANRADFTTYKGVVRHYADRRYPIAPGPLPTPKQPAMAKNGVHKSMVHPAKQQPTNHFVKPVVPARNVAANGANHSNTQNSK